MSSKRTIAWMGALGALLLTVVSPASASVFVHSVNVGPDTAGWTNTALLPQFDPSLGTLQSVQIRITGELNGDVGVENLEDKFNTVYGNLAGTFNVYDATNGLALTLNLTQTGSQVLDPFDFNLDYGGTSGYTFGLATNGSASALYTSDLGSFIGLGNLLYTITTSDDSSATAGSGTPAFFSLLSGSGTLEITYTTATIPEPGTMLTLGAALAGCAFLRRRQRNLWRS